MMPLSGSVTLADEADAGGPEKMFGECPRASRMHRTFPPAS
jgi:hypothetical protein